MIKFQEQARYIRSFNEGDSEVEILTKEIETLTEHVLKMQEE